MHPFFGNTNQHKKTVATEYIGCFLRKVVPDLIST
jgi:hypothetical protein